MKHSIIAVLGTAVAISVSAAGERPSAFTNQSKPRSVMATMLAVSSSSRQSFAGNREVYLADVDSKQGGHEFARLIDQYPGYGLPIRDSLLRNQTLFRMTVTREPDCDVPGAQVALAPSEKVVFNSSVRDTLAARQDDLIPCYKILHNTIRVAKSR